MCDGEELVHLRRRERLFVFLGLLTGAVRFPVTTVRALSNLVWFLSDLERLHGAPRRKMRTGRGCVLDRDTWLVNGSNIELGDFVKVSAFSALIAGSEAKIRIGDHSILGPGVFVVAANHGIARNGVPIRYQPWKEKPVVIGDDVWIGANAVILPGSSIGAGAVVGAGTVISGDIPAGAIVYQETGPLVMRQRQ
ncbi:acetyltransferase [Mycolicibacterium cyprinidarum]|nr:acetyltransferase [Mycolicibacterium sp. NGTWS1803]